MNKLPIYLGFFEFVFNTKRRSKALIQNLFETILAPDQRNIEDLALEPYSTQERCFYFILEEFD